MKGWGVTASGMDEAWKSLQRRDKAHENHQPAVGHGGGWIFGTVDGRNPVHPLGCIKPCK